MTAEHLRATLLKLPLRDLDVRVDDQSGHLTAIVSSPDFAGEEEGARQHRVWLHLVQAYSDDDRNAVEFVFTFTPSELSSLEGGQPDRP